MATDDDENWTVAEEVVVMEGVQVALRFATVWASSGATGEGPRTFVLTG